MAVPEEIRRVPRPTNTIVEGRANKDGVVRYTVRARGEIVYSDGRSRPKNGVIVGYIIDGEFVPKTEVGPIEPREVSMTTWAVERLALDNVADVLEDLRSVYNEHDAEMIMAMAILRVRHPELKNSRMKRDYRESIISQIYPNLPMSKYGVSKFLGDIGTAGARIRDFLRARVARISAGSLVAVDGMLMTDNSYVNNLSSVSRKTGVRGNKEISLVFAYSAETMEPVCFSVYKGNMLDSKVYGDFIEENDLNNAILMGDKAFSLNAARNQLTGNRNLHFLHPIRRNSQAIEKFGLLDQDGVLKTYSGITYRVAHDVDTGVRFYSFRDAERAADEESAYLDKIRKSKKGLNDEELKKNRRKWGTIIFQSDLDLPPEKVYDMYLQRWTIEEMFRMYQHIEMFDDTRVHSDFSVIGEHLVNFVSTLITSRLMNLFLKRNLLENCCYIDVMDVLRRSLKFRYEGDEWIFRAQTDKEKEVLRKLELMPSLPPKRGPGRPRKNQGS